MPEDKEKARADRSPRRIARGASSRVLRIVGGAWRSRRFRFPAGVDLRPTPDRVRETLFNWIASDVRGARCLDLFAGSGALGLEALSRGAQEVVFVERARPAALAIEALLEEWGGHRGQVVAGEALRYLEREGPPFGIVFLDPPFDDGLLQRALEALLERGKLLPDALVYVEFRARDGRPSTPAALRRLREGRSGEVGYDLLRHSGGETAGDS
jgi:16S rRNA (guanine966-N2)-methyltransferase